MNVYNKLMNLKMNKRCKNKNDNFRYYNSDKNIKDFKIYRLNEMII